MSKFYFRLQKVLDIRLSIEEESKIKFKEAQSERDKVEAKLNELLKNYDKYRYFEKDKSNIEQKIKQQYLNALNCNIDDTNSELAQKEEILDNSRIDLKQKQVDRKTVEILKENQRLAYIKEQNLIEQKANDEFALYGFIRKRSSEGR